MNYNNFSTIYDITCTGVDGDVDFFIKKSKEISSCKVFEVGSGTGRVMIPLLHERIDITGIEPSIEMINIAQQKTVENLNIINVSLEGFNTECQYDLILLPYRAFMHFYSIDNQLQALEKLKSLLTKNGKIVIDLFNPDLSRISKISNYTLFEKNKLHCTWLSEEFDTYNQIVHNIFRVERLDENGAILETILQEFKARWFYPKEFELLVRASNLKIDNVYSDYYNNKFTGCESQMIWELSRYD
jgi:SAM-dependent methyltransferase